MKNVLSKTGKVLAWTISILVGVIALGLLAATIVYPFEYVRRVLVWQDSDVNDYLSNFPSHPLTAAPTAFHFDQAPDEARVASLFESILEVEDFDTFLEETDTQAFIVIQEDAILYEQYFNGAQRDSLMTSFSVAKSFTSALIGIAIAEGHINSVDDAITDYLPELAARDPRFNEITIRHLLLMASGLEYEEMRPGLFNSDDPLTTYYPDQREAALTFTHVLDPAGQYFLYNKYHPQLLGMILERTTDTAVTSYLQEKIWNPIGMEYDGSWSIDSEQSDFEKMETGVNARAIDFAKFGRLYLNDGNWEGVQVVPMAWVAESTQVDPDKHHDSYYPDEFGQLIYHRLGGYYKYMWYGYFRGETGYDFVAEGDRGQFIYVAPHKNLIIVRNGTDWGVSGAAWIEAFYAFATEFQVGPQ